MRVSNTHKFRITQERSPSMTPYCYPKLFSFFMLRACKGKGAHGQQRVLAPIRKFWENLQKISLVVCSLELCEFLK